MKCLFIGLTVLDFLYPVEKYPKENSKNFTQNVMMLTGGPAANAAVTFSALGGEATLITSIGCNPLAHIITKELDDYNINLIDLTPDLNSIPPTSSIISSADTSSRTIITTSINNNINVIPYLSGIIFNSELIMIDGFYPEVALKHKHELKNKRVVLDGGSWKDVSFELIKLTTDAICSADFLPPGVESKSGVINYLSKLGKVRVAITDGAKPIFFLNEKEEIEEVIPSKVNAVDTLGAGDIFHGAYCYYSLKESNFKEVLIKAANVASASCKYVGTREWIERPFE